MKNPKKSFIILIIIIFVMLIFYALFSHKSLDIKSISFNSENVKCYDFSNGKVTTTDTEEYCKNNAKTIICTEFKNNKYNILRITPNGKDTICTYDNFITSNILEHNDILYFSACKNTKNIFQKSYLYSLKDDISEKLYEHEVIGDILQYDNIIIFTDMYNEDIISYNIETGNFEKICDGKFQCWKEYKKSIFINTDNKLSILDIKSKKVTQLDIDIIRPIAYNDKEKILLYMGIDDITTFGNPEGISKLLYLNTGKTSYTYKYQSLVQRLFKEEFFNIYEVREFV